MPASEPRFCIFIALQHQVHHIFNDVAVLDKQEAFCTQHMRWCKVPAEEELPRAGLVTDVVMSLTPISLRVLTGRAVDGPSLPAVQRAEHQEAQGWEPVRDQRRVSFRHGCQEGASLALADFDVVCGLS